MALKYWFEFTSSNVISKTETIDILHRCEIYSDEFTGDSLEINGKCTLTKASTEDTLEPIRGGGLKVELLASLDLSFEDLSAENERTFSVKYIRDSETLFLGWLSPEGLFQSWVEDKWMVNLDCTDGLGFLNNLSYVDNDSKELFTGKQTQLEIIVNCLKRTGFEQDIYVRRCSIVYDDQSSLTDTLNEVNANAFRYIKDDQLTTMTCEEVLKTVLEPYGMIITQRQGKWFIVKPNDLYTDANFTFFKYDSDGVALTPYTEVIDLSKIIGSQINDFYPFHIGAQQQLSIAQSIGAYRINYKYGLVKSLFNNIYLKSTTNPPSLPTLDEWTISDYTNLDFPDNGIITGDAFGLELTKSGVQTDLIMTSDSFSFSQDNIIEFKVEHVIVNGLSGFNPTVMNLRFKLILTDGVTDYYLTDEAKWVTTDTTFLVESNLKTKLSFYRTEQMPIDGNVYIEIYPVTWNGRGTDPYVLLSQCNFYPINEELEDIKGEIHTFQITDKPSTKIEEVKEVFNGDSVSDVYSGTIYKTDALTPTELWYRFTEGTSNFKPLLQIMGEERMKMYARPLKVFTGEVMGYIDYLSVISIDGLTGLFMPTQEYSYNAMENTTKFKLKEILNEDITDANNSGITYESALDTGQVVAPTIK